MKIISLLISLFSITKTKALECVSVVNQKCMHEFRSLSINVSCVIEKDNEYYPEIYLDECSYVKNSIY